MNLTRVAVVEQASFLVIIAGRTKDTPAAIANPLFVFDVKIQILCDSNTAISGIWHKDSPANCWLQSAPRRHLLQESPARCRSHPSARSSLQGENMYRFLPPRLNIPGPCFPDAVIPICKGLPGPCCCHRRLHGCQAARCRTLPNPIFAASRLAWGWLSSFASEPVPR